MTGAEGVDRRSAIGGRRQRRTSGRHRTPTARGRCTSAARRQGGRCCRVHASSDAARVGSWFPDAVANVTLLTCSGSTASCSATRGATRRSSPRCSASSPTVSRGPSCGSAPIRAARQRSTTAARSATLTGELPYLLKVLAAAEPLSLQVHPDAEQARDGLRTRDLPGPQRQAGTAVRAAPSSTRCAASVPSTPRMALLDELGLADALVPGRRAVVRRHQRRGADCALHRHDRGRNPSSKRARRVGRDEAAWVGRLAERYPDDPSVVATLLLNLVHLSPGEAFRLGSGNLPRLPARRRRSS